MVFSLQLGEVENKLKICNLTPPLLKGGVFNNMDRFYFTKEGLKEIEKEKEILSKLKKQKLKGDQPEILHSQEINAEYLTYMEDIDLLEVKLRDLNYVLKHAELIKPPAKNEQNKVVLGAKIVLESAEEKNYFQLVDTFEADPMKGKVSIDSSVGKTLLGCQKGQEVVLANLGKKYKIRKISYHHLA